MHKKMYHLYISRKMDLPQYAVLRCHHGDHRPVHSL